MSLLGEFRALVAQAKRKSVKTPEDEAIIAAGAAIEYWLDGYEEGAKAHIFEVSGLSF
jgi:hypothetical protein